MYLYTLTNNNMGWKLEVYRDLPCGAELCGMTDGIPFQPYDINLGYGPIEANWDGHELGVVLAGVIAIGRELTLQGYPPFGADALRLIE